MIGWLNHPLHPDPGTEKCGSVYVAPIDRHVGGRVEFTVLAVTRYGYRGCDIATLLGKSGNSVTRWINRGLSCERDDEDFRARLNFLDASISSRD